MGWAFVEPYATVHRPACFLDEFALEIFPPLLPLLRVCSKTPA